MGMADKLELHRTRHPPIRIAGEDGKILPHVLGSARVHPRPSVIYKKPLTSESDIMPNLQITSAPSLQRAGIPRGPWSMRYKCFYEIDDVQEAYRLFFDDKYLKAQASVLDAARAGGTPVFWSYWYRTSPDDGGYCTVDEFCGPYGVDQHKGMNAAYLKGPRDAELIKELQPRTDEEH